MARSMRIPLRHSSTWAPDRTTGCVTERHRQSWAGVRYPPTCAQLPVCRAPSGPRRTWAVCALTGSLWACGEPATGRMLGAPGAQAASRPGTGAAGPAHPMGFLVQFAGLPPSRRRWLLNRLATPMAGCEPSSLTNRSRPSAWAAHNCCLGVLPAMSWVTTTR